MLICGLKSSPTFYLSMTYFLRSLGKRVRGSRTGPCLVACIGFAVLIIMPDIRKSPTTCVVEYTAWAAENVRDIGLRKLLYLGC